MAAKTPAAKTKAVAVKAKAKPRGLQLTTAQQAAYNKAYTATATRLRNQLALASAAKNLRKGRLQAAASLARKYAVARGTAQKAAIAASAARMSYRQSRLAHQNSALQARIEQDMAHHTTLAGRAQYVQAGEKAYLHHAVMATLTTAQATAYEARIFRQVAKTARKASKSTLKYKPGPHSAAIAAAASAAGTKAAKTVKTAKTVKAAKAVKTRTAPLLYPIPGIPAPPRSEQNRRDWVGDEFTPNCVITAVANHLLYSKSVTVSEHELHMLYSACSAEPTIEEVLWAAWSMGWPCNVHARLRDYTRVEWKPAHEIVGGLVIGFATVNGDHAALALVNSQVVSWGSVIKRPAPVEEAWELKWES
jgi:hypothetical protein